MPATPRWYTSADVLLVGPIAGPDGPPGTAGTAVTVHLWNNKAGVGASDIVGRLQILVRNAGDANYVASGHEWVDFHFYEARVVSGLGGLIASASAWQRMGAGRYLPIPNVPNDRGLEIQVRVNSNLDPTPNNVQAVLRIDPATGKALADGLTEAGPDGIYLGLGDSGFSHLLSTGNVIPDPAGPNDKVQIQNTVTITNGTVYAEQQQLVTIPLAAAGKARYDLISLNASGVVTRTAGVEATVPITTSAQPAVPDDHTPLAYVYRDDTGNVEAGDITNVWAYGAYGATSSGLTLNVGAGPYSRVDNWLTYNPGAQSIALTPSSANFVWLLRDGTLAKSATLAARPADRALLIYEATTNTTNVTSLVDRRRYVGYKSRIINFEWTGTLVANDYRYAINHSNRDGQIVPTSRPVNVIVGVNGGASGQTRWTVEVEHSVGAWTDYFPVAAARPTIAFGATTLSAGATPERFDIPANARLRAFPSEIPGGGAPTYGRLFLEVTE